MIPYKDHGKVVWGLPFFHTGGLQLKPRGQVVSLKFFGHVLMFLQLAEGRGFPDQDGNVSLEEKQPLYHTAKSTLVIFATETRQACFTTSRGSSP